ncbi:MAG: cytochrome bc1 complex diheme cytochrome c subunit [Sporichthyaceae bacterium]
MKRLTTRRRHPMAAFVVLLLALFAVGGMYSTLAPGRSAEAADSASSLSIAEGKGLFVNSCSSCHGLNAEGSSDGPSLIGVGAASVDFQVGTGRMPLQSKGAQAPSKAVAFTQQETQALAAYVASLGAGPAIPAEEAYATDGDIQEGGQIFRTNCASCHAFTGNGGALSQGKYAPSLSETSPKHLYEAMLTGPQSMPVFNDGSLSPEQKKDVVTFVTAINAESDPGGYAFGRIGPVSEGMVLWTLILGALVAFSVWLGAKPS